MKRVEIVSVLCFVLPVISHSFNEQKSVLSTHSHMQSVWVGILHTCLGEVALTCVILFVFNCDYVIVF